MTDIDWLAVEHVCSGYTMKLTDEEQLVALRRLLPRMAAAGEWTCYSQTLTTAEVARRMGIDERTLQRRKQILPDAEKRFCPVCRNDMWVLADGTVEPHPAALQRECPMSGRTTLRGLAAYRPELYRWAWSA